MNTNKPSWQIDAYTADSLALIGILSLLITGIGAKVACLYHEEGKENERRAILLRQLEEEAAKAGYITPTNPPLPQ